MVVKDKTGKFQEAENNVIYICPFSYTEDLNVSNQNLTIEISSTSSMGIHLVQQSREHAQLMLCGIISLSQSNSKKY